MSWFGFGKQKSNLPGTTPLQQQRTRQIESLRTIHDVREIQRDAEYCVNFVAGGHSLRLEIKLPSNFPQDKPAVYVKPNVQHPWVDNGKVTGCPALNNFTIQSDLSRAIKELIEEFQRCPPQVLTYQHTSPGLPYSIHPSAAPPTLPARDTQRPHNNTDHGGYRPPTLPMQSIQGVNVSAQGTQSDFGARQYNMPEVPTTLQDLLQNLSVSELQQIADDEDRILELIAGLPQLNQLQSDRVDFCQTNEKLAKENLSRQPAIENSKEELMKKYSVLTDLKRQFDNHCDQQQQLGGQFKVGAIQANLKIATMQAEEESENIAEDFLSGKIDIDTFKNRFMEKRTLCHLRRAKEDKLQEMITQHSSGGGF